MLDVGDMRTFVEVADAGGVSPAARRLGVSKSIVSRRLSRLEMGLGVQLLARTTRGSTLTEAGMNFRDHACRVCEEIDVARETMATDGELRGRLRVAAPLSFNPEALSGVFADMARRHPNLQLHISFSDGIVDIVRDGFDCAIRIGFLGDSNLLAQRVGSVQGSLVASPEYVAAHGEPETPGDILSHEALMLGTETWRFVDGDRTISVHPLGRFKADNGTALAAAAVAGLGVAWLPNSTVEPHLRSGALVVLMSRYPPPTTGIYVVRPPARYLVRKIRIMTELLSERLG